MTDDYKYAKEAFVSDTTGSSIGHINGVSLTALVRACPLSGNASANGCSPRLRSTTHSGRAQPSRDGSTASSCSRHC
jgi:hypothetical protein